MCLLRLMLFDATSNRGDDSLGIARPLARASQTLFNRPLPIRTTLSVALPHRSHVFICRYIQGRAHIDDFHPGARSAKRRQAHVHRGHERLRDERHILHAASRRIEECVDPDALMRTVLNREHCSLNVFTRLRKKEFRIPVLAGPASLPFRAEESRGADQGSPYDELEVVANVCRCLLSCRMPKVKSRSLSFAFPQSMAIGGVQRQAIDVPELFDFFQGLRRERRLAFKCV